MNMLHNTRVNLENDDDWQTNYINYSTYLIRKLRHMVGHRAALVLPRAHVVSLGVLLPPWTRPITLAGTILHVTNLLWPRSIVPWKYKKETGIGELLYKTELSNRRQLCRIRCLNISNYNTRNSRPFC